MITNYSGFVCFLFLFYVISRCFRFYKGCWEITALNKKIKINDLVISTKFGIGEVVGFEKISQNTGEFLIIKFRDINGKVLIPLTNTKQFRKVLTKTKMKEILATKNKYQEPLIFESKRDRIAYFQEKSVKQDIRSILKTIYELQNIDERSNVEDTILKLLMDTLALEIGIIMEMEPEEAYQIINNSLENNK